MQQKTVNINQSLDSPNQETQNLMAPYSEQEDPLQKENEVPDFNLMSLLQDLDSNDQYKVSTQQTNQVQIADDKTTSMKTLHTNVKRSPNLPIFNNCR